MTKTLNKSGDRNSLLPSLFYTPQPSFALYFLIFILHVLYEQYLFIKIDFILFDYFI